MPAANADNSIDHCILTGYRKCTRTAYE